MEEDAAQELSSPQGFQQLQSNWSFFPCPNLSETVMGSITTCTKPTSPGDRVYQ